MEPNFTCLLITFVGVISEICFISGGWVLVINIEISSSTFIAGLTVQNSYRGIENYKNNVMALTNSAMNELCKILLVTELRFHCRKQMKRTFHVTTAFNKTGQAVVQYFCGQTDELPLSCDSFKVMRDDNSILARRCNDWGDDGAQTQVGTWGITSPPLTPTMEGCTVSRHLLGTPLIGT